MIHVKEIFGTWAEFRKFTSELQCHCLFRGHSSADYSLVPSIGRPHSKYQPDARVEEDLLAQFKIRALPFLKSKPANDLEWLIIGRHYGLKTRLLDWTQSPYIALYFALQSTPSFSVVPCSIVIAKQPRIVGYEEICLNHRVQKDLVFFEPPHLDMRIANQESYLALHPDPFRSLDDDQFVQFNLYPFETKDLENILFDIGIRHSTIYPDLGGVCSHLNDNPSFVPPTLEVANPAWRPIPKTFAGRTVSEIEHGLLKQRSLWYLLQMRDANGLIGIPVETPDGGIAKLRAVYPEQNQVSIWIDGRRNVLVDNEESALADYKVDQQAIGQLFPQGLFMRTKRPLPSA